MNLFIVFTAQYLLYIAILFASITFLSATRKDQKKLAKLAVISFPLSYIIAKIASHLVSDPRPFVVEHIKPLFSHVADNGFPSDHTLLAMTIAAVIFTYNKKFGVILTVLAICIGVARVLAHVHHIEDIVGSIMIAIIGTFLGYYSLKKAKFIVEKKQEIQ